MRYICCINARQNPYTCNIYCRFVCWIYVLYKKATKCSLWHIWNIYVPYTHHICDIETKCFFASILHMYISMREVNLVTDIWNKYFSDPSSRNPPKNHLTFSSEHELVQYHDDPREIARCDIINMFTIILSDSQLLRSIILSRKHNKLNGTVIFPIKSGKISRN